MTAGSPRSLRALRGTALLPWLLTAHLGAGGGCAPGADRDDASSSGAPDGADGDHAEASAPPGDAGGAAVDGPDAGAGVSDAPGETSASCPTGAHLCAGACLPDGDAPSDAADPCVLTESFGVFVSPAGSDRAGTGSRAAPFATLGRAMDAAVSGGTRRVYACGSAGDYRDENLVVDAARDGVRVYGGLDCTTTPGAWTYRAAAVARVAPATPGYALRVSGVLARLSFEDFAFVSRPAAAPGESSVAVLVAGSEGVSFTRVAMTAADASAASGAPGAAGGTPGAPSNHATGSLDGQSAAGSTGALPTTCRCPDGSSSTGGSGGDGAHPARDGQPAYGPGGKGGAGALVCGRAGAAGRDGQDAPRSAQGPAVRTPGALSVIGWTPAEGTPGGPGGVGQGGGGGGDGPTGAGGGAGGACGGCGGAGGAPGGGGGSSVALLLFDSAVAIASCTLTAGDAAPGGAGGGGEPGQAGGASGSPAGGGCAGGGGGAGGGGNGAQGGAGGLSLGVGYAGTPPTEPTRNRFHLGSPGAGGAGGAPGAATGTGRAGRPGATGPAGVAADRRAL